MKIPFSILLVLFLSAPIAFAEDSGNDPIISCTEAGQKEGDGRMGIRLDCFAQGTDSSMLHKRWDGTGWSGWENLGGYLTSRPSCVSTFENRHCFVKGSDQSMYYKWFNGTAWSGWENFGGYLTSAPNCVSWLVQKDRTVWRIDCFVKGKDQALYYKWWDATSNRWSGWENLGGYLTSEPNCISSGGIGYGTRPHRIDCFARGLDQAMYHKWSEGAGWSGWENLGGFLTSTPNCVVGSDLVNVELDCFIRGENHSMYNKRLKDNRWGEWISLGGWLKTGPICVGVFSKYCYAIGEDSALYINSRNQSGTWSGWKSIGGKLTSAPECIFMLEGNHCLARGLDWAMWHIGNGAVWESLGGVIKSNPNYLFLKPTSIN